MYFEKYSIQKRHSDMISSPCNLSDSQSRVLGYSGAIIQQKKIFGFEIYVDNDILNQIDNIQQWFKKITTITNTEYIRFNNDLSIPDLGGHNIQIYDKDMNRKYHSCKQMLADVHHIFKRVKNQHFSIIIFVPEGMVSLLIGTKGHQINKIMKQSHTTIVVNQPINRMTYRTVKIQGHHADIALACKIIYEILEEKSSIAYSIEKQPSQLDYSKAKVRTKFIFSDSLTTYLCTKKKSLIRKVQEQTKCSIKFNEDSYGGFYKREEEICTLTGKLQDVQAMLVILVNLVNDYYCEDRRNVDYTLKMLIPSNYVTKLIGQKGYMIRDIIERSGGAQIKILSEKQSERDTRECVIAINGSRQNKIDATCLILQQIQCFKNGGPILQSGKSINQNLAQQFKNSIPLRQDDLKEEETQNIKLDIKFGKIPSKNMEDIHLNNSVTAEVTAPLSFDSYPLNSPLKPIPSDPRQSAAKMSLKSAESNQQNQLIKSNSKVINTTTLQQKINTDEKREGKAISPDNRYSRSYSRSRQRERERSRDRQKRKPSKRQNKNQKREAENPSVQFKHQKELVQIKLIVPRKLANDHNQLSYIESLCNSEIKNIDQRVQGSNQAIISVKGLIKDNQQCIKLLQKRIARINTKQPF